MKQLKMCCPCSAFKPVTSLPSTCVTVIYLHAVQTCFSVLLQMARLFKLLLISASGSEYDVMFNPKDLPEATVNSVLEIYHPDALMSRLLVQVRMLRDDIQQPKDTISLSSNIVKIFSMKVHKDVYVRVVSPSDVAITLVEVCDAVQFFKSMCTAQACGYTHTATSNYTVQ